MSIEQSMALKGAYTVMKIKLLKYEPQVKIKPIFPISTMLGPSLKFEYIPSHEKEYITKTLKYLLQLMPAPPISSACSQSEPLSNTSTTCRKMMVELMKSKRKKNINILREKPISDEILISCMTLKLNVLILMLYNGGVRLGLKNIHDLQCKQRDFSQFVL